MHSLRRLIPVAVTGACILGLFSGCAKVPDQEIAVAKAAIKAAQDAEADKYMPNNFQNVQKAMASAEGEIQVQNITFVFSRNYTKAKKLLKNTTDLATQMAAEAPKAKADLKAQVEENLTSAQKIAKELHSDIKKAPRSTGKQVLAQMTVDLDVSESALAQASEALAGGNLLDARKRLADAQKLLAKIIDQLKPKDTDMM